MSNSLRDKLKRKEFYEKVLRPDRVTFKVTTHETGIEIQKDIKKPRQRRKRQRPYRKRRRQ